MTFTKAAGRIIYVFLVVKRLNVFLKIKHEATIITTTVKIGRAIANRLSNAETPASAVAIAKFPNPPVVAVEVPRTSVVVP